MRTPSTLLLLAMAAITVGGCVERKLMVRTDPPGAMVRVNSVPAGASPVEIPFDWYGTVRIESDAWDSNDDGLEDYRPTVLAFDLEAPWYEYFPVDFFTENLLPWTIEDRHETTLVLRRSAVLDEEGMEALREKAVDFRFRAENRRAAGDASREGDASPAEDEEPSDDPR